MIAFTVLFTNMIHRLKSERDRKIDGLAGARVIEKVVGDKTYISAALLTSVNQTNELKLHEEPIKFSA